MESSKSSRIANGILPNFQVGENGFVDDYPSPHYLEIVFGRLETQNSQTLKLPSRTSDLNPIEYVWVIPK